MNYLPASEHPPRVAANCAGQDRVKLPAPQVVAEVPGQFWRPLD